MAKAKVKTREEVEEVPTPEPVTEDITEPEEETSDDGDTMRPWSEVQKYLNPIVTTQTLQASPQPAAYTPPHIKITQDLGAVLLVKRGALSADQVKEQSRGLRQYGPAVQVVFVDDFRQVELKPSSL